MSVRRVDDSDWVVGARMRHEFLGEVTYHDAIPLGLSDLSSIEPEMIWFLV